MHWAKKVSKLDNTTYWYELDMGDGVGADLCVPDNTTAHWTLHLRVEDQEQQLLTADSKWTLEQMLDAITPLLAELMQTQATLYQKRCDALWDVSTDVDEIPEEVG